MNIELLDAILPQKRKCIRLVEFWLFCAFKACASLPDLLHNSFIPSIKEKSFNWTLFSLICTKASLPRIFSKFLSPSWKVEFWQDQNFVSSKWMDSHFRKLLHTLEVNGESYSVEIATFSWICMRRTKEIIFVPLEWVQNGLLCYYNGIHIFPHNSLFLDFLQMLQNSKTVKDVNIRSARL